MRVKEYGPINWPKFMLFGDSITQQTCVPGNNFFSDLQNAYVRRMDIINRGFSGYTSRHALKLVRNVFDQLTHNDDSLKLAYVFFGSNDCSNLDFLHVPVDEYVANMRQVIRFLVGKKVKVIVVGSTVMTGDIIVDRHTKDSVTYNHAARDLAKEMKLPFLDLYRDFLTAAGIAEGEEDQYNLDEWDNPTSFLLSDGLHFSPAGYKVFYDGIMKSIADNYPELLPRNLPDAVLDDKINGLLG